MVAKDRGYVRVSTLKDSQKDSPEHQESFIREIAAREDIELDHIYQDRDTATNIVEREDVKRIIEDAKRGEVRSIWFASLSRFSRDALDAITLKRILVNVLKVRVVSIEDGYDSGKKDDELLFGIKSVVNQNSSGDISVSSRRGIRQSAEQGNYIGSIPPYGYKKVTIDDPKMKSGKRKTLEIVEDQARVVRLIYDLYVNQGMGEKAIVNYLNGDNENQEVYTPYRSEVWGLSSIQRILQNENYTGYSVFGRHTTEVAYNDLSNLMDRRKKLVQKPKSEWQKTKFPTHEAIISQELYDQAQETRLLRGGGARGGRRSFVNVFAKFIFCAECGTAMVSMSSLVRGRRYRYLMCSRRRRTGEIGCCNSKWIPYYETRDELIKTVLVEMKKWTDGIDKKLLEGVAIQLPNNNYDKEKKKLERKIEDNRKLLFEIRRQNLLGEIDSVQYEFEKSEYEKEINENEQRLSKIRINEKRTLDVEKNFRDIKRALTELSDFKSYDEDIEKIRTLLLIMVKRIEVNKDGKFKLILNIV